MGRYYFLTILFLAIGCVTTYAQPTAYATLKPEVVETGDTFQLTVLVSSLPASPKSVDFASWSKIFPLENILSKTSWRRSGAQWIQQFTLIAFDSSRLNLPPLTVFTSTGNPLPTNELSLTVYPTRGESIEAMAPIRDIVSEPVIWLDYWPWAAGFLLLLLIIGYVIRRPASRVPLPQAPPAVQPVQELRPIEIALKKLNDLQNKQLWKHETEKEHYAELSLILREYLERRRRFEAMESTTTEINRFLAATGIPKDQLRQLNEMLNKSDLVKYAQSRPPQKDHEAMLETARAWMIQTDKTD
ncbi:MAG: hypothetical protein JNJ57_06740 [Saprospiraceae bacterium]|nr:hypothetical protein [Saprospiraceae bacterium]